MQYLTYINYLPKQLAVTWPPPKLNQAAECPWRPLFFLKHVRSLRPNTTFYILTLHGHFVCVHTWAGCRIIMFVPKWDWLILVLEILKRPSSIFNMDHKLYQPMGHSLRTFLRKNFSTFFLLLPSCTLFQPFGGKLSNKRGISWHPLEIISSSIPILHNYWT